MRAARAKSGHGAVTGVMIVGGESEKKGGMPT